MTFVDTNFFLRFLIKDNPEQFKEAKKLFLEGASGELGLITSTIVVFEIYWVLKTYYQKTKPEIIKILQKILRMDFMKIEERDLLQKSLTFFKKKNFSLEDCYNLVFAHEQGVKNFKTFDQNLRKIFKK